MKKYLLVCFLAIGTLLPTSELKSSIVAQALLIDIHIEGDVLSANSDPATGNILQIQIFRLPNGEMVRSQGCESPSCSISLAGLPSGAYIAYVIAQNGTATKKFKL